MRNYSAKYYPAVPTEILGLRDHTRGKTYPNLIILAASWDSVKMDDNEPADFTSSIGKTIYYLTNTDLIDHQLPNVVVVVTKSLTFWCDYDDFDSEEEKGQQWQRDADEKSTIINDLRSKAFPSSSPWPVIFVENGGGKKTLQRHRTLPNGELSHQNLFQAIAGIMSKAQDLVGMQALRFVTGAENVMSQLELTPREILCQNGDPAVPSEEGAVAVSSVPSSHSSLLMCYILGVQTRGHSRYSPPNFSQPPGDEFNRIRCEPLPTYARQHRRVYSGTKSQSFGYPDAPPAEFSHGGCYAP
jgi:hypothetical protein